MNDVRERVRHFILDHFLVGEDPSNLTDDTELKESGILDSLSTLKLVTFLEETYGVEFEADDLDPGNLSCIANIDRLVAGKRAASGA